MTNRYLPQSDIGKANFLKTFADTLPNYATKYKVTPAEVNDVVASAKFFKEMISYLADVDSFKQALTYKKNELRDGLTDGNSTTMPTFPTAPTPLPGFQGEGVIRRITALVARIKGFQTYAKGDGEMMGIEKPEKVSIRWDEAEAVIKNIVTTDALVIVKWLKWKSEGVHIYCSLDMQNFTFLGRKTKKAFEDHRPNQGPGAEYRYYKVRFVVNDKEVGKFSPVAKVLVDIHPPEPNTP